MTRHLFLESFDRSESGASQKEELSEQVEAIKAQAYEAGYTSGWDDAIASDKTSRLRMEAEFERNIQNLAFTFGEAVTHVRSELRQFLETITDQFLPAIAPDILREHVRSELLRLGEELTDIPVELVASPDCNPTVAEMLKSDFAMEITLVEDADLSEGQVYLRLGAREMEINLEPLMKAVSTQLSALNEEPQEKGDSDV